jgi:hypothetical protein
MQSNNQPFFSKNCYRSKFNGVYQTVFGFVALFSPDLIFIHQGECQCEGKTGIECQEPGDVEN